MGSFTLTTRPAADARALDRLALKLVFSILDALDRPKTPREIAMTLGLPSEAASVVSMGIASLVRAGFVVELRGAWG